MFTATRKFFSRRRREKIKIAARKEKLDRSEDEKHLVCVQDFLARRQYDTERVHIYMDNKMLEMIQTYYPRTHEFIESLKPQFGYLTREEKRCLSMNTAAKSVEQE